MNVIAFMGTKGGCGSTTSAHLACLGSAWKGIPSYLLHTDTREPAELSSKRPYRYIDARDAKVLARAYNKLIEAKGEHWAVIDSGGNRDDFDAKIKKFADLIICPTDLDPESVKFSIKNAQDFNQTTPARILVRCPLKLGAADQKIFDSIPKELLLGRVDVVKASKMLKADDDPETGFKTPPTNVNNLARKVHGLIFDFLNKPIDLQDWRTLPSRCWAKYRYYEFSAVSVASSSVEAAVSSAAFAFLSAAFLRATSFKEVPSIDVVKPCFLHRSLTF